MHPWDRLQRSFPGQRIATARGLEARLAAREVPAEAPRTVPGEKSRSGDVVVRKISRVAQTKPNAPLLIRLVRHPYALEVVRGVRAVWRDEVPWQVLDRKIEPSAMASLAPERARATFENPVRTPERSFAREARLSVEVWLAS